MINRIKRGKEVLSGLFGTFRNKSFHFLRIKFYVNQLNECDIDLKFTNLI
jgi:hypothetical protein